MIVLLFLNGEKFPDRGIIDHWVLLFRRGVLLVDLGNATTFCSSLALSMHVGFPTIGSEFGESRLGFKTVEQNQDWWCLQDFEKLSMRILLISYETPWSIFLKIINMFFFIQNAQRQYR